MKVCIPLSGIIGCFKNNGGCFKFQIKCTVSSRDSVYSPSLMINELGKVSRVFEDKQERNGYLVTGVVFVRSGPLVHVPFYIPKTIR